MFSKTRFQILSLLLVGLSLSTVSLAQQSSPLDVLMPAGSNTSELLDPKIAFAMDAQITGESLQLNYRVAEGYYVYVDKFNFASETPGVRLGKPMIPLGQILEDEFFGEVEVLRDELQIEVPFTNVDAGIATFVLAAQVQGCADIGVCYPPFIQKTELSIPANLAGFSSETAAMDASKLADVLGLDSEEDEILDPDVAFAMSVDDSAGELVNVSWKIAEGHYLYKERMNFDLQGTDSLGLGEPIYSKAKPKEDEFFGKMHVFYNKAEVKLPIAGQGKNQDAVLHITFQGCSEITGICYPPLTKKINVAVSGNGSSDFYTKASADLQTKAAEAPSASADLDGFTKALAEGSLFTVIMSALGFGLLLAFTACMYPMIPIVSGIIVGHGANMSASKGFTLSLIYVASMATVFGIVGAIIGSFGSAIGVQAYFQHPALLIPFALLFVALSMSMFGFYDLQIPSVIQSKLTVLSNKQSGGSWIGVALMGGISALIIGPCGGPILVAALSYASTTGPVNGFIALFTLGFGMGLPLLLVGAGGGKALPKAGTWMTNIKIGAGVILLGVAILMLERMPSIFPPLVTMLMWASLFIVSAIYMGALEPVTSEGSGWKKFSKGFGLVILLYGSVVLLGGLSGSRDVTNPLHGSKLLASRSGGSITGNAQHKTEFIHIKTKADLQQALATASASKTPVMLDFYADWCTYCIKYEEYVFSDSQVAPTLQKMVLLQADVTAMDEQDTELMKHTKVVLPPAILLFDVNGVEIRKSRIVGDMDAPEFLTHIKRALQI